MKRSVILFSVLLVLLMVFGASQQKVFTSETGKACCQKFLVVNQDGNPVGGCTIKIVGQNLSCVTGNDGMCEICFTADALYTAVVSCPGHLGGSTTFEPCVQKIVKIVVE